MELVPVNRPPEGAPRVLDHAGRYLNSEDARDAVGNAVLALWKRWPTLSPEERSDNYFFGVVHRCVKAMRRKNRRFVSLEETSPELDAMVLREALIRHVAIGSREHPARHANAAARAKRLHDLRNRSMTGAVRSVGVRELRQQRRSCEEQNATASSGHQLHQVKPVARRVIGRTASSDNSRSHNDARTARTYTTRRPGHSSK